LGEGDGWRDWLTRHGPGLVLFARQWTMSPADAEDAVQEGFIHFWRARRGARDELAYLYSCVRTAAMDLARSGRRRRKREEALFRDREQSGFAPEQAELAEVIESALATLPAEQREVVVMKIWGGLTFAQIASATDISPNTAASRYRYALERLGAALPEEVAHD
jgi:RNA polymerase sigma-70 factor (ECF subfamily)